MRHEKLNPAILLQVSVAVLLTAFTSPIVAQAKPQFELEEHTEVIARRGEVTITAADLDHFLSDLAPEDRPVFLSSPERLEQMLEGLLLDRVLAADLLKQGYLEEPVNVAAARQVVIDHLAKTNRDRVRQVPEGVDLEQLARERYQANRDRHVEPEKVSFTQILLRTGEEIDGDTVRQRADDLHRRIVEGEDFDQLVMENSQEPRLEEHRGRFEETTLDQLVERFASRVSRLESPGEISEPFSTEYGWHIVRLDSRIPLRQKDFEEVREELVRKERASLRERMYQRHVNRLLDEAPAQLEQEAFDRFMQDYLGTE